MLDIKVRAGISDDEFCRYIDIENIHKTIPLVNRYINNLPGSLNDEQKAQALVASFRSFTGITGSRLFQNEYMHTPEILFSFMDGPTDRELTLDLSSTGMVLSYHYDVTTGVYAKVNNGVPIEKVFYMINLLNFEVREVMYGTWVSSRPTNEQELQRILDELNTRDYTHESDVWLTSGDFDHLTGKIIISPYLVGMHNKAYQDDWLAAMREYGLTEAPSSIGYAVEFIIPENAAIPMSHWGKMFRKFNILETIDFYYNRYTLADETMEGGHEGDMTAVDSKIQILPVEAYTSSPQAFLLYCTTERQYGSRSYPIITAKSQSTDVINISFKGVPENIDIGDASIGPATAYINLGALAEETYTINLYNGDVKQTGTMTITAESYTIEMADNPTFGFVHKVLNRIPERTIWGYVPNDIEYKSSIAALFLADLEALGAERASLRPGYYHEFSIDQNGNIVQPEPYMGIESNHFNYLFHYADDLARIDALVDKYAREYSERHPNIHVFTGTGEQFLSWMYDI